MVNTRKRLLGKYFLGLAIFVAVYIISSYFLFSIFTESILIDVIDSEIKAKINNMRTILGVSMLVVWSLGYYIALKGNPSLLKQEKGGKWNTFISWVLIFMLWGVVYYVVLYKIHFDYVINATDIVANTDIIKYLSKIRFIYWIISVVGVVLNIYMIEHLNKVSDTSA